MFNAVRIDDDPTSWELSEGLEQVPTSGAPVPLQVSHPLMGTLVLSPRSVGSAVFFETFPSHGTHPNGIFLPEQVLYVPSPTGLDVHSNPPNFYTFPGTVSREALQADITAAMTDGTFLTVDITEGVVVINGATVSFAVLCPPTSTHL